MATSDRPHQPTLPSSSERIPASLEEQPIDYLRPIFQRLQPSSVHLAPCTLEQYQHLAHGDDRYELVDGLLLTMPRTEDPEHYNISYWLCLLLWYLPPEHTPKVQAYVERPLTLSSGTSAPISPGHSSSSNTSGPPPSPKSPHKSPSRSNHKAPRSHSSGAASSSTTGDTCRRPDFIVVDRAEGSEASGTPISPFQPKQSRTAEWKKAIMVGEVTSTNRVKDLRDRVREYQREKIREYIILDRQKLLEHRRPCVEVHNFDDSTGRYRKRVYSGSDKVDCSFFTNWDLSADQMLDYKFIRDLVKKHRKETEQSKERAARMKEERDSSNARAARMEQERDRSNKKLEHAIAFFKGERQTPPRGLELHPSQLKLNSTNWERGGASRSPTSPTSPPRGVRKVAQSDIKSSSHKSRRSPGKKK